jgi:hypothetical protein
MLYRSSRKHWQDCTSLSILVSVCHHVDRPGRRPERSRNPLSASGTVPLALQRAPNYLSTGASTVCGLSINKPASNGRGLVAGVQSVKTDKSPKETNSSELEKHAQKTSALPSCHGDWKQQSGGQIRFRYKLLKNSSTHPSSFPPQSKLPASKFSVSKAN